MSPATGWRRLGAACRFYPRSQMSCPPGDGLDAGTNTDPASREAGTGTVPAPPNSDDRALLEVLVQAVEPDQRAADGDHRPGVISDDEPGRAGRRPQLPSRRWVGRDCRRCAAVETVNSCDVCWVTASRAASAVGPTPRAVSAVGAALRAGARTATSARGASGASACCARAVPAERQRTTPARAARRAKGERTVHVGSGCGSCALGRARAEWWRLVGARSTLRGRPRCELRAVPQYSREPCLWPSDFCAPPPQRCCSFPRPSPPSRRRRITAAEIDGHLRFLSSDLLEGRAPGTRGGRLTAEYIASQLRAYGVEPGVNGSYFQPVPIDVMTTQPASVRAAASGKATATLRQPEDVVLWGGSAAPQGSARGEARVRRLRVDRAGVSVERLQGRRREGQGAARARQRSSAPPLGADAVRRAGDDVLRSLDLQVRGGRAARCGGDAHRAPHRSGGLRLAGRRRLELDGASPALARPEAAASARRARLDHRQRRQRAAPAGGPGHGRAAQAGGVARVPAGADRHHDGPRRREHDHAGDLRERRRASCAVAIRG